MITLNRNNETDEEMKKQKAHNSISLEAALELLSSRSDVSLIESSFVSFSKTALFVDKDFGIFQSTPFSIARSSKRHPDWWTENKKRVLSEKNRYSYDHAQSLMPPGVAIVADSYKAFHKPCSILDETHGSFIATPKAVAKAKKSLHPSEKCSNDGRFTSKDSRTIALSKLGYVKAQESFVHRTGDSTEHAWHKNANKQAQEVMLEKYGERSAFAVSQFQEKSKLTCQSKYGSDTFPVGSIVESKGEKELKDWINSLGIETVKHNDSGFEIDVYVPALNLGFEYNGVYWHSTKYKKPSYHAAKTAFFRKKGIRIIHIFECFWAQRQEQTKDFIRSALRLNPERIGSRKCVFTQISPASASQFCKMHHMQGSTSAGSFNIGVFRDGILIGCAVFGKSHRQNLVEKYFLKRLCFKSGVTVSGCLSKIALLATSHFKENIFSFADLSISDGKGYLAAGWEIVGMSKPDYFYSNQKMEIITKQSRKKSSVETPLGMTEDQHAELDGLFKIWDCGKMKLMFPYKA